LQSEAFEHFIIFLAELCLFLLIYGFLISEFFVEAIKPIVTFCLWFERSWNLLFHHLIH